MKSTFLFLGTGASSGVPIIGCSCPVCSSPSSANKRLRSSGLLKVGNKQFLIDAGPDLRRQALRISLDRLDGLLLTHTHFDHIAGLDDLRIFYFLHKRPLPTLLSNDTFEELKVRYHYLMRPMEKGGSVCAQLQFEVLNQDFGAIEWEGVSIAYFNYWQLGMKVTGYRVGDAAYVSDIRNYSEAVIEALSGVNTLIVSALRHEPSPMHLSVDEAIAFARKVGARHTWLTHISHDIDHEKTDASLPPDIRLGYDGLEIPFE
jgi:phosphoribosyl 1,2-cyclic phosphate phosphodiesterase